MIWILLGNALGWLLFALVILAIWLVLDIGILAVAHMVKVIRRPLPPRSTNIFYGKAPQ